MVRRRWYVVVAGFVVGVLASLIAFFATPDTYVSEVTFYVSGQSSPTEPGSAYEAALLAETKVLSYVELLTDPRIGQDVAARLGGGLDPVALSESITAVSPPDTALIRMTVEGPSPEVARGVADAVSQDFPALVAQLERPGTPGAGPTIVARVVRPASFSPQPASPLWWVYLTIGVVGGLVLGLIAALALDAVRRGAWSGATPVTRTTGDGRQVVGADDPTGVGSPLGQDLQASRGDDDEVPPGSSTTLGADRSGGVAGVTHREDDVELTSRTPTAVSTKGSASENGQ